MDNNKKQSATDAGNKQSANRTEFAEDNNTNASNSTNSSKKNK